MDTLVNYTYTSFRAIFVLSAKGSKDGLFDAVIETLQHNFLENPSLVYDKEKDAAEQLVSFFNEQLISLFDQDYIELLRQTPRDHPKKP